MQLNEEDILLAMNGQEKQDKSTSIANKGPREEPTVFFYILFGLVFEALSGSTSSSASGPDQQNEVIASLSLLKSLVRPEYAGNALVGTAVFEEFMSLCYRTAMTESASILVHLLQVMTTLAIVEGQKSSASDGLVQ
jgi:HEAT repeat-containing protein 5